MMDRQHVLLTGATGALGPALAAELLAADPSRSLSVLIRSGAVPAEQRFAHWLESVAAVISEQPRPCNSWRQRVRCIAGDVRTDGLGLSPSDHSLLAREINAIIHAAADTQFLNSLDDLWETNVEGTRRVLDFAKDCRTLPRLIAVSTVCTSGTLTGPIDERFQAKPPKFVNNYERTKWEAERLALSSGVPLGIARVSIVVGSHASGTVHRTGALHHLFKWFSRGLVPVIPGTDQTCVDLICNETAARFIAKAMTQPWESGIIWHVAAGAHAAPLLDLCNLTWSQTHAGEPYSNPESPGQPFIVDQHTFDQVRFSKTTHRDRVTRQAMDSVSSFLPMLLYPRTYDTARAQKLWGGPLPCPDWKQTVSKVLRSCGLGPKKLKQVA
jgi:nucleoside-diphosphate-sugar epimerase